MPPEKSIPLRGNMESPRQYRLGPLARAVFWAIVFVATVAGSVALIYALAT